jgi:site-specific DNA recombinase
MTLAAKSASATRRVGIWIRVSTEDQALGESPEHHQHRARMYAESKGWTVVEVYHLEGVSGKSVWDHPEAQRMRADVAAERIEALIFSKLARLARNTRELLDFAEFFQGYGADLVSLQEAIDTSTPAGRLFYTMIAAMAQWEREEISSRVAASVPVRAKLGKPLGGAAPFGYRWVGNDLVPDEQEAPVRKLIYELFAQHRRKKAVARLLNERGYRTRRGRPFSDTTVERLIRDPTAKGIRRANYTKSRGAGKGWDQKPDSEWILTPVPAIIPEELWDRCNAIIDQDHKPRRQASVRPLHLFGDLLFCGTCQKKMHVPSGSLKYVCPTCRAKLPALDLENVFASQLRSFVFSPDEIARHLEAADEELQSQVDLLETLRIERQRVQTEMNKLYDLYLANGLSPHSFTTRNRPLEERAAQLDDEIPRLAGEADFRRIQLLSSTEIVSEAQSLYSRWNDLSREEKRAIIETITERITFSGDEIHIDLLYMPKTASLSPSKEAAIGQPIVTGSSRPPS